MKRDFASWLEATSPKGKDREGRRKKGRKCGGGWGRDSEGEKLRSQNLMDFLVIIQVAELSLCNTKWLTLIHTGYIADATSIQTQVF